MTQDRSDEVVELSVPRLFVSYSWTSAQHAEWVLQLATELRESGVDVVLDKWDLKEGHDAHAFMESMVTEPTITKVILICDKAYADKADGRSGGVGTEAQIISGEIYAKTTQDKFVAVVADKDEEGKALRPGLLPLTDLHRPERSECLRAEFRAAPSLDLRQTALSEARARADAYLS